MWEQVNVALRQSLDRVLAALASFIPGILALLVSVVIGAGLGWLLAVIVRQLLRWARFDQNVERLGLDTISEWSPGRSPALLVSRLVFWVMMLIGILVGLAALDATLMSSVAERLMSYVPHVFVAVLLILAGSVLARYLARGVLISAVNLQLQSARLLSLGVKWMVIVLTVAMVLDQLAIGGSVLKLAFAILFGGIVLAMALAVGLGSKDLVSRTWERQQGERPDTAEHTVRQP
jgi:hypothetical protein